MLFSASLDLLSILISLATKMIECTNFFVSYTSNYLKISAQLTDMRMRTKQNCFSVIFDR